MVLVLKVLRCRTNSAGGAPSASLAPFALAPSARCARLAPVALRIFSQKSDRLGSREQPQILACARAQALIALFGGDADQLVVVFRIEQPGDQGDARRRGQLLIQAAQLDARASATEGHDGGIAHRGV